MSYLDENGLARVVSGLKDYVDDNITTPPVQDVQVNGVSVLSNGVADVPVATSAAVGVVRVGAGLAIISSTGQIYQDRATLADVKAGGAATGNSAYRAITPIRQGASTFYGLAEAAGDTTQSESNNAVGTYTEEAKSKIHEMLDAPVAVSGTTPTITAKAGVRYICGEVTSLSITPSASGITDVIFTSGSTVTVLTLPQTVKMPEWFDVESGYTYEISIMDGVYGAVMSWPI